MNDGRTFREESLSIRLFYENELILTNFQRKHAYNFVLITLLFVEYNE